MSCAAAYGSTDCSMSRLNRWYGGCSVSTGRVWENSAICPASKLETPTCLILPSATSLARVPAVSANGTFGSGQCTWYRSRWSVPRWRRLSSTPERIQSGLESRSTPPPGLGRSPPLVAMTSLFRSYPCSAFARSCSEAPKP